MNEEKGYFYLLKGKTEDGRTVYAQQLSTVSSGRIEPTLSSRAEFANRYQRYEDAKEFLETVKRAGNNVSKINFLIVKYLMPKEQLSWATPKGYVFPEYEDLLGGRGYE